MLLTTSIFAKTAYHGKHDSCSELIEARCDMIEMAFHCLWQKEKSGAEAATDEEKHKCIFLPSWQTTDHG